MHQSQYSFPLLETDLEGFFYLEQFENLLWFILDPNNGVKIATFELHFHFGVEMAVHRCQIWWIGCVWKWYQVCFWQESQEGGELITDYIVVIKFPLFRTQQVQLLPSNILPQMLQNIAVELSQSGSGEWICLYNITFLGVTLMADLPRSSAFETSMPLETLRTTQYLIVVNLLKYAECFCNKRSKVKHRISRWLFVLANDKMAVSSIQVITKTYISQLVK